jgi:hypothetical protein
MFVFTTSQIPRSSDELAAAIAAGLCRRIRLASGASPVTIAGETPALSSLEVDVSNGSISTDQPMPDPTPPADPQAGPTAASFVIRGHPILIENIPIEFDLSAKQVAFTYGRNGQRELIATLSQASDGHIAVQLDHEHLESAILFIAKKLAASSGVAIISVTTMLSSISPTTVDVKLNITAKKFVTAQLRITGRLSVNERMVATASNLTADGDGMVGNIAVSFIRPHLTKLNGTPLPLLAFSLGSVKLRSINVATDDGLRITAEFGSLPA